MSCPSIVLDMITPIINGEQYKLQSSSLCNFLNLPVASSLLSPNSHLKTFSSIFHKMREILRQPKRDGLGSYLVALVTHIISISIHCITGWIIMKSCTRACNCFHFVQPFIFKSHQGLPPHIFIKILHWH